MLHVYLIHHGWCFLLPSCMIQCYHVPLAILCLCPGLLKGYHHVWQLLVNLDVSGNKLVFGAGVGPLLTAGQCGRGAPGGQQVLRCWSMLVSSGQRPPVSTRTTEQQF